MNIDLAFKGFLRLLKSATGQMRGGKYLNRKWTGKRWDYEYMGQKKKSSKDTSTPSLFAESGIANKTSVNPIGQEKPVSLSQESRAAATSATQIPLFGKKKVEEAKPVKPSFSLVQEDKTTGEKKNAANANQGGLFGKKTDSEAFTKKDFKPEFKLEGNEITSSLVTNVKNALLKEGLDSKAREFVDKAFKEKDLDSIKNLASQYVEVKGDLVTKPTSEANKPVTEAIAPEEPLKEEKKDSFSTSDFFGRLKTKNEVLEERPEIEKQKNSLPFQLDYEDIPTRTAINANTNRSFSSERRGYQIQNEYVNHFIDFYNKASQYADTPEKKQFLIDEINRYKKGYLDRQINLLHGSARIASSAITGGGNFPVRTMTKRMDAEHKKEGEFYDFQKKVENSIINKLKATPENTPIRSTASDASSLLQNKLAGLEKQRESYKKINQAHINYLKNPASLDKADLSEDEKKTVKNYVSKYSWEPHPIAPYQLSNLSQNIKQVKDRIAQTAKVQSQEPEKLSSSNGVGFEINKDIERVQLSFPGKPTPEQIQKLKRNGFKWSPTNKVWQRQSTSNGVEAAKMLYKEFTNETQKSTFSNIFKSLFLPTAKINLFGLPITIERKRGTYRTGKDVNGIPWATKLDSDYGYIRRTYGADGEHIDCYVGQNPHSELVFVVNQKFPTGRFDEHKVMLGYDSKDTAIQSYLANNPKAKDLFDSMEILTLPQFKQWLMTGSKQRRMEINVVKFKSLLAEKLLMKANGYTYIKKERQGNRWKYWYKDDATGAVTTSDEAKDKQDGEPKQLTFMDSIKNFFKGDVKKAKEEYQKDFQSIGQGTPETSFQAQYKEYFTNKEKIDDYLKRLAEKRGQAVKPATKNDTNNVKGTDENAKKKLTIQAAIQRMPKKIPGTNIDVNVAKKLYEKYGNGAIKDNFDTMPEGEKKKSEKSVEDYKKYFNVHSVDYLEEMKDMYSNDPFGGDNTNKLKAIDEVINQKTGKDSETKPVDNKENPDSKFKVKTESGNEWDLRNDPKNEKHKEAFGKLTANDHKEIAKKHTEIGKTMSDRKQKIHHSDMSFMHSKKAYEASKKQETPKVEVPKLNEEEYLNHQGVGRNSIGEAALHKNRGKLSDKNWTKLVDTQSKKDKEILDKREALRKEYQEKLKTGDIQAPSRNDELIKTANGHPDHPATQAARRLLEKKNISWETAKAANTPKPKLSPDERKKKVTEMSAKVKQVQAQAAEHLADKKIESESNRLEENHTKFASSFNVKPANEIKTKSQYTSEDNYDKPVIEGIKQSILANGYDQSKPITIDSDGFVVDGHHRFTAVSELIKDGKLPKDTPIPTITKTYENEAERLMDQVSANKMRRTVNIMDDAKAYSSLVAQGKTPQEISDRTGESIDKIRNTIALNNLIPELQHLLNSDHMSDKKRKDNSDGTRTKQESLGQGIAISIARNGVDDDGKPNGTIQRKAFAYANQNKGATPSQVADYIKTLKSQNFSFGGGIDEKGRSREQQEALRNVGGDEGKAHANASKAESFIKDTHNALSKLFGASTGEIDPKLMEELTNSIVGARGEGKAQSLQDHIDTMVKTLVAARDMIKNNLGEIKGNASMDDMFAMAKSDLWRKRALFELNKRIYLARKLI